MDETLIIRLEVTDFVNLITKVGTSAPGKGENGEHFSV